MTAIAKHAVAFLREQECKRLFVLPGSSMVPFLNELSHSSIEVVPALHEPAAVAMADGYSRIEGLTPVSLYMVPGTASGLSNLYNAWCDESPLLLLSSQQDAEFRSPSGLSVGEADLVALVGQWTRFAHEASSPEAISWALPAAARAAAGPPSGPAFISVPQDVFEAPAPDSRLLELPLTGHRKAVPVDVAGIAERLRTAERPIIIAGGQVQRCGGEVELTALAEELVAPVFYEPFWNDRLSIAPWHPLAMGELVPQSSIARDADVVIAVGCRYFHEIHPRKDGWFAPDVFVAHVNADQTKLDAQLIATWTCSADPTAFLAAVRAQMAPHPVDDSRREERERYLEDARERRRRRPTTTQREIAGGLRHALEVGYLVDESVSLYNDIKLSLVGGEAARFISTTGGSLGWGVGSACGVAHATGEPVTLSIGDGGFYFCIQSLWNARRDNLPVAIVVFDNEGFGSTRYFEDRYVERHQESLGARYLGSDFRLRDARPPVVDIARAFGIPAVELEDPLGLAAAHADWAADASGPIVIHVPLPFGV